MVSEGGGQGLLVLACLQDLSQARSRWGSAADGFLSLFGTTVVLPGIADTRTLRDVSALAGEHEVASTSTTRTADRWGITRASASVGTTRVPRMPVDAVARGARDRALVLGPRNDVIEVRLTPAHERSPWIEMLTPVQHSAWTREETVRSRGHNEDRAIGR
jgi:type IV secretory pathway TraG/TraD family ATPase VirD4